MWGNRRDRNQQRLPWFLRPGGTGPRSPVSRRPERRSVERSRLVVVARLACGLQVLRVECEVGSCTRWDLLVDHGCSSCAYARRSDLAQIAVVLEDEQPQLLPFGCVEYVSACGACACLPSDVLCTVGGTTYERGAAWVPAVLGRPGHQAQREVARPSMSERVSDDRRVVVLVDVEETSDRPTFPDRMLQDLRVVLGRG